MRWWILLASASVLSAQTLEAIRDYALHYSDNLPNYTATQSIQRKHTPLGRAAQMMLSQTEQIEEQIGYNDHRESHKITRYNGRKIGDESPVRSQGAFSTGEFGGILDTLFQEESRATFTLQRTAKHNGRRVSVYQFHVPAEPAGYGIIEPGRRIQVAFEGTLLADSESNAVLRIQFHCVDFPANTPYKGLELTLDYAPAKISGRDYILPARYAITTRRDDGVTTMEGKFRDYQKFGVESSIIFESQ
jgi:hypothetical protein